MIKYHGALPVDEEKGGALASTGPEVPAVGFEAEARLVEAMRQVFRTELAKKTS